MAECFIELFNKTNSIKQFNKVSLSSSYQINLKKDSDKTLSKN